MKRTVMFVVETGSLAGGVRVIGEMANGLVDRGWPVEIWSVNPRETMAWFPLNGKVEWFSFFRTGTTQDYEQLEFVLSKQVGAKIATFWRTAYATSSACKPGEGYYLIQDVETSYTSAKALASSVMSTYAMGLHNFTTSRWVQGQLGCDHVGIGVSGFYHPLNLKRDRLMVLGVLRQQALKGYGFLMETTRSIRQFGPEITLFGMAEKLRVLSPIDHYHVRPTDDEVLKYYNTASCFMSCSQHEGFNLTCLEAMNCGLPVVKTQDDGSDEYSLDDMNCLVAKTADEMAGKVMRVLSDKALATRLSEAGLQTASEYTWKTPLDKLEHLLETT
jgi:hypothetical protein